jgi:NAD(P)H dehydrogenase (quinone)
MYAVTGATGQLGQFVVHALLKRVEAGEIVALVRTPAKAGDLAAKGVTVRPFDYGRAETLKPALEGVERLLLISSSEVGRREAQHRAVIEAAVAAGVKFIAYTSILHADTNPLDLALEHRATEAALKASGIPHALLRNGWYNENYTVGLEATAEHGVLLGSTGTGRVSSAARADYAEAAATVLADGSTETRVYELAGDAGFTQDELAGLIASASGKAVAYNDLPEEDYRKLLEGFGLPAPLAHVLADSSAKAKTGALFDDGHALAKLIGRPTTPIAASVKAALAK